MCRSLLYPTGDGRVYKIVHIALQNLVRTGGLMTSAVVLDHLVGVKDIGANLAPPFVGGRRGDGAAFCLCPPLGFLFRKYFCLEKLHPFLAVGELTALTRNVYREIGRVM